MKAKGVSKPDSFEKTILVLSYSLVQQTKADKYSSCFFSCPCWGRCPIFTKIIIVLFWVIIYSYLRMFFRIGVLKALHNLHENTCVGVSFNQPAACFFFSKRLWPRCFLWNFKKLSRTPFSQGTLNLLLLYLWNISVI